MSEMLGVVGPARCRKATERICMLMVIFGAGASYDSSLGEANDEAKRPPLAQQLFDDRAVFNRAVTAYPACRPLVGHLRDLAKSKTPPVLEDVLAQIVERAEQNPETKRQLLALRFYLRDAVARQTSDWLAEIAGFSNYGRLLRRIGEWRAQSREQVVLVTFNYDVMLDSALAEQMATGQPFHDLKDYVDRDDWKLCKLHGSTDWVRRIRVHDSAAGDNNAAYAIGSAGDLDLTMGEIVRQPLLETIDQRDGAHIEVAVPAIAVPTTGKSTFETHQTHLQAFDAAIPKVDRLLIVGWRGIEQHVLDRIKTINPHYALGIVDPKAKDVFAQLEGASIMDLGAGRTANVGNRAVRRYTWAGFSELVRDDDVDQWLRIQLPTDSFRGTELQPWANRPD
jgi:hypothetical protein